MAETEHLTNAAHDLHLTPPALSRTLKVLEEDLGKPLFERKGRGLKLNADGERLLVAVRTAMRVVHDAVAAVEESQDVELTMASSGIFTVTGLNPMLTSLADSHPHVRPRIQTTISHDPGADLLQGHLDLLWTSSPLFREGLSTVAMCRVSSGVYCGPGHALFGRADIERSDLSKHAFVAPGGDPSGMPIDGWPGEWRRKIGLTVDRQSVGIDVVGRGRLLAVLPDLLSRTHPHLWRLPIAVPASTTIYAVFRETVADPGPVEAAVSQATQALRDGLDPLFIHEN